eukprot:SAG11_NODE_33297_length_278_cov_0.581006_1_plen_34_part_10
MVRAVDLAGLSHILTHSIQVLLPDPAAVFVRAPD